jgi:hypothetical protein
MKRQAPLIITFLAGLAMILGYFIPHEPFGSLQQILNTWYMVVAAFAMILGVGNLVRIHTAKIRKRSSGFGYSYVLLAGLAAMAVFGITRGIEPGTVFYWMWWNMHVPMSSTMFSLLAFFVASASYRAFRARNIEAALLLIAGILVMIGRVPMGDMIWSRFPDIADWIMNIPNAAGQRAILIGIALGVVSTSLRLLLGIERTYLTGE